jgi:YHS domain-containing protein
MAKVRDPVCGMTIESTSATERIDVGGRTYYFCSAACRAAFEADVDRYTTGSTTDATGDSLSPVPDEELEQHEPPHTTWRFLTSPKFGAAGSGGLEYERLPEAHKPKGH